MNWDAITAIFTAWGAIVMTVEVIVIIAASVFAIMQLREMTRARYLDAVIPLFAELNAPKAIEARRFVYADMPDDPTCLKGKALENVETVLRSFDMAGFLIYHGLLPKNLALSIYADVIARCWVRVEPFLRFERKRRNQSWYMEYAEKLAKDAQEYIARHHPGEELTLY